MDFCAHRWRRKGATFFLFVCRPKSRFREAIIVKKTFDGARYGKVWVRCILLLLYASTLARLSEMPTSVALPTSHHFHPSKSTVVSLSLGILHEWMRTQMLSSQLRTSSRELEATTGAAAHHLDEEHS